MKRVLLVSLGMLLIISLHAQSGSIEAKAKQAATEMCTCVNEVLEQLDLHPKIIEMVYNIEKMGAEEAQKKFVEEIASLTPEELTRIQEDGQKMQTFDAMQKEVCPDLEEKFSEYNGNAAFEAALLEEFQQQDICELAYVFFKLGTQSK